MDGDAYRDMSHGEMQQLIWRKVAMFADYANIEQRLPNGKVADVFYQVGQVTVIVEVKIILKESLLQNAWNKYAAHCQYLAIASPPQSYYDEREYQYSGWQSERLKRIGIWQMQWTGITEVRRASRLDVKTPGHVVHMSPAFTPFAVIASPGCTAREG